jgi:hypothetical protein
MNEYSDPALPFRRHPWRSYWKSLLIGLISFLMSKILVTLPPSWDTKISAIEDDETMTLERLERTLRNFQNKLSSQKTDDIALAKRGRGGYRGRGRGGYRGRGRGRGGYQGNDNGTKVIARRITKEVECWHCLQKGHYQASCPLKQEREKREKQRRAARAE